MPAHPLAPVRPPTTRTAAPVLLLLAAALVGCGSSGPAAATKSSAEQRPLDATALAALADDRPSTALPPAAVTTAQAADALAATQPAPGAVGAHAPGQVRDALALAARAVAATRADRGFLCGPPGTSALSALATPALKAWLADPANAKARVEAETTISASEATGDCGPLRWVGPGVVPGQQIWEVVPGTGDGGLDVMWSGSVGYALADSKDRPEPWGMRGRITYRLVQDRAGKWRVDGWADGASGRVAQGWPRDVPVPEGYLTDPPVPVADPRALKAVRSAAKAWAAAQASDVAVEQAVHGKAGQGAVTATATAAPARGDATGEAGGTRMLWLDRGRRALTETAHDVSGKRWAERGAAAPVEFGVSAPVSPFAVAALLAGTGAAAPSECPGGLAAAECFTALVATAGPGQPLAADVELAHRAGIPWLVLDVGVDAEGRPAFVRVAQQAMAFGGPYARLVSTARFTAYPTAPPARPAEPDPASVAAEQVQQ